MVTAKVILYHKRAQKVNEKNPNYDCLMNVLLKKVTSRQYLNHSKIALKTANFTIEFLKIFNLQTLATALSFPVTLYQESIQCLANM